MPRFEPFRGLRYHADIDLNQVTAPPYDVLSDADRAALAATTGYNIVHLDLPVDQPDGGDRYLAAARTLAEWQDDEILVTDDEPSFYLYGMGYRDESGRPRHTVGVIGALELARPGEADVLPHEHTTPKAKSDRLALTRATGHNLSPIWGLSLAEGLSDLVGDAQAPVGRATDELGVHHRLWKVDAGALTETISAVVDSAPVVIADGHHRYETSLAYRDERRAANGDQAGAFDLTMALVVELTESQLAVRAIHRLVAGLPAGFDLLGALEAHFEAFGTTAGDDTILDAMDDAGALGLVLPDGSRHLLRPRPEAFPADLPDLDSSRVAEALRGLPSHDLTYQHGVEIIAARVSGGDFDAGLLLRPVTVEQIARTAHARDRMPPKSTYFYPKPRTGFVLRSLG